MSMRSTAFRSLYDVGPAVRGGRWWAGAVALDRCPVAAAQRLGPGR